VLGAIASGSVGVIRQRLTLPGLSAQSVSVAAVAGATATARGLSVVAVTAAGLPI